MATDPEKSVFHLRTTRKCIFWNGKPSYVTVKYFLPKCTNVTCACIKRKYSSNNAWNCISMKLLIWIFVVLFGLLGCGQAKPPPVIYIGALLSQADEGGKLAVDLAINYINSHPEILPDTELKVIYNNTRDLLNTFENIQSTCYQAQRGVSILIGPASTTSVKATHPLAAGLHIPHIAPFATDPLLSYQNEEYPFLVKMSAPDWIQSLVLVDVVKNFGWSRLAIIASRSDYGRNGVSEFQRRALLNDWVISSVDYFHPAQNASTINLVPALTVIKNKGVRVVLLNCLAHHAKVVLEQASKLGMTTQGWGWIVTDGITAIEGLYNPCTETPLHLRGLIGTRPAYGRGELFPMFQARWINQSQIPLEAYTMRTFDSVLVAAYGLHDYLKAGHVLTSPSFPHSVCQDPDVRPWSHGQTLLEYIVQADGVGVMNHLNFTSLRYPAQHSYEVVNLKEGGWSTVGDWLSNLTEDMLQMNGEPVMFPGSVTDKPPDTAMDLNNVSLIIVTIKEEPFVMETSERERADNPTWLYKGLCIDLINEMQKSLKFHYSLYIVEDGNYGGQDPKTQQWNGMVGDIIKGKADLVVAPLTINYERQQHVDFTKPFMDLGLTILMAKEAPQPGLFKFLEPFEWSLWLAVCGAFVFCAVLTTGFSYISPFGYRGRYTQGRDVSQKARDQRDTLRLYDSLWYSFASWMQQGSDVSPRCLSGRLIHGVWWFAVMVISATYTANLAAFLTVARLDSGINSVSDLAYQTEVKYGTVYSSAPAEFFRRQNNEPYNKMNAYMREVDSGVANASTGIDRVQASYGKSKGKYAFIWDSAPLEYVASRKPCITTTVGRLFHQFGYGLALNKNSHFTEVFNLEVLKLRQSGYLEGLRASWITHGACQAEEQDAMANTKGEKATLQSMAGVFFLIAVGVGVAVIAVVCECCVAVSRDGSRSLKAGQEHTPACCSSFAYRASAVCSDIGESLCGSQSRDRDERRHSNHSEHNYTNNWDKERYCNHAVRSGHGFHDNNRHGNQTNDQGLHNYGYNSDIVMGDIMLRGRDSRLRSSEENGLYKTNSLPIDGLT